MSSGDDTFLSAYMDGQLDFDQQKVVESALVASAELAENLRALVGVRELVAGLPRDACADVSPEVMRRIRSLKRSQSLLSRLRARSAPTRRVAAVAGVFTLAAGIMLIVTAVSSLRPRDHGRQAAAGTAVDHVVGDSGPGVDTVSTDELGGAVALNPGRSSSKTGTIHSTTLDTHPLTGRHDEGAARTWDGNSAPVDLELARRMLDNPSERRFFFVKNGSTNGVDEKARQQVASVVERTTRFGFFKFTISQGIVIDPHHPDQATVFALLVNPKELGRLRDQLNEVLPEMIDETPADPGMVTQLADIGHVQEFPPAPPADVLISREALALRTRVGGTDNSVQPPLGSGEKTALPIPEQYRSAPDSATTGRSGSPSEHSAVVVAADDVSRGADAAASARARFSDPIFQAGVVPSQTEQATHSSDAAKSDKTILVFVWVNQSRPS